MKIQIIAIGKIKDKYLTDGINEYIKRLSSYAKVEIIEVNDSPIRNEESQNDIEKAKNEEGSRVLKLLKPTDLLISLDLNKQEFTSEEFASFLDKKLAEGGAKITFVIGGSYGLSDELKKRSNYSLSFSKMTFTHQMTRLILLEQIYRGFKILNNETYHK